VDDADAEDLLMDLTDQALLIRQNGTFGIHDLVRDFLRRRLGEPALRQAHGEMADAIQRRSGGALPVDEYVRRNLGYHLENAGRHDELYALVAARPDWARECYKAEGTFAHFTIDLKRAWTWAATTHWDAAKQVRSAVIEASTRSLAGQSSPELLVNAVRNGYLRMEAAVQEVARMPKSFEKSRALSQFVPVISTDLLPQAISIARDIGEPRFRAEALVTIMPRLPLSLRTEISAEILRDLSSVESSFVPALLVSAAKEMPASMRPVAIETALRLPEPGEALIALANAFHGDLDADIFAAARNISDAGARTDALVGIVSRLGERAPAGLGEEALEAVRSLHRDDFGRFGSRLLPALPAERKPEVIQAAEAFGNRIEDPQRRAEFLIGLARKCDGGDRDRVATSALAAARSIATETERVDALLGVAPLISDARSASLDLEVNRLEIRGQRIRLLASLPQQSSPTDQGRHAQALLAELGKANNGFDRMPAWEHAVGWLSDAELAEGVGIVLRERAPGYREWELGRIFESLDEPRRLALLANFNLLQDYRRNVDHPSAKMHLLTWFALSKPNIRPDVPLQTQFAQARMIDDLRERGELFARLLEYLPPDRRLEVLNEGLDIARAIDYDIHGSKFAWIRSHVLVALGRTAADPELDRVFAEIEKLPDPAARASAQARLAERVPLVSRDALIDRILATLENGASEYEKRDRIGEIAQHLSERTAGRALSVARTIETPESRAFALADVLPHLSEPDRAAVIREAVAASAHANFASNRPLILMQLLRGAPPREQAELAAMVEASLGPNDQRLGMIFELSQYFPEEKRRKMSDAALQTAAQMRPERRISALLHSAEYLPAETVAGLLAEGQRIAGAMPRGRDRAELLVPVAEKVSAEERPAVLADALDSALSIKTISGAERQSLLRKIFELWKQTGFTGLRNGPAHFSSILASMAANRRPEFLNDLGAVLPLIWHLDAKAIAGTFEAVRDVCRWWP
jgi:hypothetical protein